MIKRIINDYLIIYFYLLLNDDVFILERQNTSINLFSVYGGVVFKSDRLRLVHAHMDYITSMISDIDFLIDSLVKPYENAVQLLCTLPGVNCNNAITIIL